MTLYHCPVRLFTPEVSRLFDLFYDTHAIDARGRWARVSLPAPGGVSDQPARELEALGVIASTWNALIDAMRARQERAR